MKEILIIFDFKCLCTMVVIFFCKIKLWGKIKAVVLFLILFFFTENAVPIKVAQISGTYNIKSGTEKKKKVKKASGSAYQLHFNKQTKKVQKRMKRDEKKTKYFYNKKLGHTLLGRLFGKKKNR